MLGEGGMGVVYRATDLRLNRTVALKLLAPELSRNATFRRRFERECEVAAGLDHPHVIPIFDAGQVDGVLYLCMRYVKGTDLAALIQAEGALDAGRVCVILSQAAGALDAAHAAGLVHRDVKPGNFLIDAGGGLGQSEHVYLSDFGLTRPVDATSITTGQVLGSIPYMAPERFQGAAPHPAIDLYALGCVAFECLTGVVPFERDSVEAVIAAHLATPPPSVCACRADLPAGADAVLAKAMAKTPEDRYPSCAAFVAALRAELAAGPTAAPPPTASVPVRVAAQREAVPPAAPPIDLPAQPAQQRPHSRAVALAVVLMLLLVAVGTVLITRNQMRNLPSPKPPPTDNRPTDVTATPTPPPTGAVDTTCQVQLPATGSGSAEGIAVDPVATAASNNPALTTFVTALKQAGLIDTLNGLDAATVFAPTNDAFAKVPPDTLNAMLADQAKLTSILTLHVVPGQKLDAQALAGMNSAPTVNGEKITLAADGGALSVNGQAKVICPNVKTANATVHTIDTVLMPKG
ncbi:MAG: protein kinase domain-containing protein [Egibacteraceae bacterium]